MNPSIDPSKQQVGYIQEERGKTLEQVRALENMIAAGKDKVYESAQLRELVTFACWRLM